MSAPFLPEPDAGDKAAGLVLAETYYGETKPVALASLRHRVSVYAIIVEDEKILMVKTHNHRYYFPGGGVNVGEPLAQAVRREAREELNAEVEVGPVLHADDMVYYHDPAGRAAHLIRLYFDCRLLTRDFTQANAEERDEILSIEWVPLNRRNEQDFLPSTRRALDALIQKRALNSHR